MLASEVTMDSHKYGFLASVIQKSNCIQKLLQLGGSGKSNIESEHQHLFVEMFRPFQPGPSLPMQPHLLQPLPPNPAKPKFQPRELTVTSEHTSRLTLLPLLLMPPPLFR